MCTRVKGRALLLRGREKERGIIGACRVSVTVGAGRVCVRRTKKKARMKRERLFFGFALLPTLLLLLLGWFGQ